MSLFTITIAGIRVAVASPLSPDELRLPERLGAFMDPGAEADSDVSVRWHDADPNSVTLGPLVYDPGEVWRLYRAPDADGWVASIAYEGAHGTLAGTVEADAGWRSAIVTEQWRAEGWQSLLASGALELILRARIVLEGGLVLHASAIDDNGRGVLFVGHSGAGKSTHASLWDSVPGAMPVNDDRVAVRLSGGVAMAYGAPWGGTAGIARNHKMPISAVFVLEQAPDNDLRPMPAAAAMSALLARCFAPFWDSGLLGRALDTLERLQSTVPVYLLRCRPDADAVAMVREAVWKLPAPS